jgi:NADH-quinone oxidoreductase subunit H
MNLAWKFLLPLVLLNLGVAAIWHYTAAWGFLGAGLARWTVCSGLLVAAYAALGNRLYSGQNFRPRTYRYAT